jgi:hypothetical protein
MIGAENQKLGSEAGYIGSNMCRYRTDGLGQPVDMSRHRTRQSDFPAEYVPLQNRI